MIFTKLEYEIKDIKWVPTNSPGALVSLELFVAWNSTCNVLIRSWLLNLHLTQDTNPTWHAITIRNPLIFIAYSVLGVHKPPSANNRPPQVHFQKKSGLNLIWTTAKRKSNYPQKYWIILKWKEMLFANKKYCLFNCSWIHFEYIIVI